MNAAEPTDHGPGSTGKIEVMTQRYDDGLPLWHEDDAKYPKAEPSRPTIEMEEEDDFGAGLFDGEEE